MKKFNTTILNKLALQMEEAKEQGLHKLASGLESNLNKLAEDSGEYSISEMRQDVYNDLWAVASNIIKYYDVNSVDALEVHAAIEEMADDIVDNIKKSIKVNAIFGPLEPKTFGETK